MKKHFFILLISLSVVSLLETSCSKEEICALGVVRFTNTSSNPYNLFINGLFETQLAGNSFIELNFPEGQYAARVEQVSGFLLFPTVVQKNLTVFGCDEIEWVFP